MEQIEKPIQLVISLNFKKEKKKIAKLLSSFI